MKIKRLGIISGLFVFVLSSTAAFADTADDIKALARAQWQAQMDQAPAATINATLADEYTEFNPSYPTRLDGKALAGGLLDTLNRGASKLLAADMVNPKVQIYGDVAILTYNFVGVVQDSEGENEPITAKSTRVYAKKGGDWKLVHANFAPLTNSPDN